MEHKDIRGFTKFMCGKGYTVEQHKNEFELVSLKCPRGNIYTIREKPYKKGVLDIPTKLLKWTRLYMNLKQKG